MLGGNMITPEAERIKATYPQNEQEMFVDARGDNKIRTGPSQAVCEYSQRHLIHSSHRIFNMRSRGRGRSFIINPTCLAVDQQRWV
jgi:hypothetical protein